MNSRDGARQVPHRAVATTAGSAGEIAIFRLRAPKRDTPSTKVARRGCQLLSAQVVFLYVIAERTEAHSEELRGLDLHAAGARERLRDVPALDLLHVRLEIDAAFGQRVDRRRRGPG